ncbi:MAG: glucose-1-phosphate adenylyltransferase [Spirochaetaceae bacterium]|nr:MAG: glucose-1-phosphate adenylyltransferase [Spirochaetaceae bacterium]
MPRSRVLTIVLGGGKGTRLYPLTMNRAKPAVPFAAKFRLVDIPLSNSINAGFKKIYVLTQFNSASLHLHIANTYIFDAFTKGFVEILAAQQTFDHTGWYEGTGDAVRKNFVHFRTQDPEYYLILSGDQLYRMDLEAFFREHVASGREVSLAATTVTREQATALGILTATATGDIVEFNEKPPITEDISRMRIPAQLHPDSAPRDDGRDYLASMGIYCFNAAALERALDNEMADFGKEIIPALLRETTAHAYVYSGYWEDIGTIKNFYETNLNLASNNPEFDFYAENSPIYTRRRDLPPSKFISCTITESIVADGCIINDATIAHSVVGIRTRIEAGSKLDGVICMGADYYETDAQRSDNRARGVPNLGIGLGTRVERAIIDKDARIGDGCRIGVDRRPDDGNYGLYFVRDGIIVIPKTSEIPAGTVI